MKEELEQIGKELKEFSKKYDAEHVDLFIVNNTICGNVYSEDGKGKLTIFIKEDNNENR